MTFQDDLPSLHAYNRWADARLIEAARKLTPAQYTQEPAPGWTSVRATLIHIAGATHVWARRLAGETITQRPLETDFPTLEDAVRLFQEGHDDFDRLIAVLTPEKLAATWSYRNLQGGHSNTPLWAVYRHVVNHATYHRGQAASKLKLLGVEPPSVDFIHWAIEQTDQPET